jgi:hypothetical protein
MTGGLHHTWRRRVAGVVVGAPAGPVLDLATGTADLAIAVRARDPGRFVAGADFAEEMLRVGQAKLDARGVTRVRLAVAEEMSPGHGHRWRAGGLLLQFLPKAPERARVADLHPGDAPEGTEPHQVPEDDAWVEGRSLVSTVEDIELIDPALSTERLVYRLFHERGVRVFRNLDVRAECSCSRENVEAMLKSFSQDDRDHMVENGLITVTCEFCNSTYVFEPDKLTVEAQPSDEPPANKPLN